MGEKCDLVMKGGITSGVVYPRLIAHLATEYDFVNIGGTSAGAIAAAGCAAAQYAKYHHTASNAFDTLNELPEFLGKIDERSGKSRLFRLFQPAAALRAHFAVLAGVLGQRPGQAVLTLLTGIIGMYRGLLLAGLLLGSLLLTPFVSVVQANPDVVATVLTALLLMLTVSAIVALGLAGAASGECSCALLFLPPLLWSVMALILSAIGGQPVSGRIVASVLAMSLVAVLVLGFLLLALVALFARGLLEGLHGNGYGLCSGRTEEGAGADDQGLTDWLTGYLNGLAQLDAKGRPLTFGDLWGDDPGKRDINLEMMTTAVSQQMVYSLPFRDGTQPFYYLREEWQRLFPAQVMDYLDQLHANGKTGLDVRNAQGQPLRPLPRDGALPVVVAVRMSLSFPVLLSAIPLYAVDRSMESASKDRQVSAKRVWFSDGGLGSNLPLHMFDAMLPGHPTFAINLKAEHPKYPIRSNDDGSNAGGRIYLPDTGKGGRQRFWEPPDDSRALGGLVGFFVGMINTMQSWRDELMFPTPGFRDRIVQISLRSDEGGLNLNMPQPHIIALGKAGQLAAQRLIDRFHPNGQQHGEGWRVHCDARLRAFLGVMQPACVALNPSLQQGKWHFRPTDYNAHQHQVGLALLTAIQDAGAAPANHGVNLAEKAPPPLGQVKITPKI